MNDNPSMIIAIKVDLTDSCNHLEYIRFPLDLDYRSVASYNSFANGIKKRNYGIDRRNPKFLWTCGDEHERQSSKLLFPEIPIVDVENIWEFYELIGFDYKTNKWIKEIHTSSENE